MVATLSAHMSVQSNGAARRQSAPATQRQQTTPAQSSAARITDHEGIGTAGILPGLSHEAEA